MRLDPATRFSQGIGAITAPTIGAGGFHRVGANGIQFNIAHAGEQVGFIVNHTGLVISQQLAKSINT